jgi:uncharacterized protein
MTHEAPHQRFHEGELELQRRLGELDEARRSGRALSSTIVRGAFRFIAAQPFAVAATRRSDGAPRASLLVGEPGFAEAPDERTLRLDLSRLAPDPLAPWTADLARDPRLGLLFLDPDTRRRLRVNGRATRSGATLRVDVAEAYPNCPKYIQRRLLVAPAPVRANAAPAGPARRGVELDAPARALIAAADTFFIASANPEGQLDASHRGGPPGFVEQLDARTLRVPDYAGNHMYNTLGNLVLDPRAGVTFVDFATGRLLAATGRVEILHDVPGSEAATGGTRRYWQLAVDGWTSWVHPAWPRWCFVEASPFLP